MTERLSHLLSCLLRTGWQGVITQGKSLEILVFMLLYYATATNWTRDTERTDNERHYFLTEVSWWTLFQLNWFVPAQPPPLFIGISDILREGRSQTTPQQLVCEAFVRIVRNYAPHTSYPVSRYPRNHITRTHETMYVRLWEHQGYRVWEHQGYRVWEHQGYMVWEHQGYRVWGA